MKRIILLLMAVSVVIALTSAVAAVDFENATIPGLNITTDIDGAFEASHTQNRTLAIVFDQDSCIYCDMLKEDVLSDSEVQKELNEKFIVLLVDINENPDIAIEYEIFGTPSVQFLNSDGADIGKIEGYVDADEFLDALKEI